MNWITKLRCYAKPSLAFGYLGHYIITQIEGGVGFTRQCFEIISGFGNRVFFFAVNGSIQGVNRRFEFVYIVE